MFVVICGVSAYKPKFSTLIFTSALSQHAGDEEIDFEKKEKTQIQNRLCKRMTSCVKGE